MCTHSTEKRSFSKNFKDLYVTMLFFPALSRTTPVKYRFHLDNQPANISVAYLSINVIQLLLFDLKQQ